MAYDTDEDPYIDQATGVFRNVLGFTNEADLEQAEANMTSAMLAAMVENPVVGNFDLTHLVAIHHRLFDALYPWAGELRTVEMVKGSTRFANAEYLEQAAKELFGQLQAQNRLLGLPDTQYIEELAHYYSEVNVLHPFREGNGRTQRAFFSMLASESGREISWEKIDPNENIAALVAAYSGDEQLLRSLLMSVITNG